MKDAWLLSIGLGWIVWAYWPSWREAWERRRARRLIVTYRSITPNEAFYRSHRRARSCLM